MVKEISTLTTMSGRRTVHPQPSHYGRRQRPSAPEFFPTIYEAVDASTLSADQSFDDSMGALGAEHIVAFYDAFSNLDDCSIMISMEYMVGTVRSTTTSQCVVLLQYRYN
jgi:enhancing lycopene biosynthesis protein 2